MRTELPAALLATDRGQRADAILRACVHCGFCTAVCPTYQQLGDELDGPRGRIYLIKTMLETGTAGADTRTHLDRCLTCRACETVCPSGVEYGALLEIGRSAIEQHAPRALPGRTLRWLLRKVVGDARVFGPLLALGRLFRPLLPAVLARRIPARRVLDASLPSALSASSPASAATTGERVVLLDGCSQRAATPATNEAAVAVLAAFGVQAVRLADEVCCGSLPLHLAAEDEARARMRHNVRAFARALDAGARAIISTASGCGVTVRDYGHLLAGEPDIAADAARVAAATLDIAQWIAARPDRTQVLAGRRPRAGEQRVAWHAPCTLQHGQRVRGVVEPILQSAGFELVPVADPHLCCGSAGTYSITQPELSTRLRDARLAALEAGAPQVIATANLGCEMHLATASQVPVRHWLELLARTAE